MKNVLLIAVTAVAVSLDSFMAGFSLSLNKRNSPLLPSAVALITLLLCLVTSFIGRILSYIAEKQLDVFGAGLLVLLALTCLLRKEDARNSLSCVSLGESLTIGVAVGMDASIANLSLTGVGNGLVVPVVFAVTHYFTVALGQILAKKVQLKHTNIFSAVILVVLAISKLL